MVRKRQKTATQILREDLEKYRKKNRIGLYEVARRISEHGSNFNTVVAFLRGGYDPAPDALSEMIRAFRLLNVEIDKNAVLAAILSSAIPHQTLWEAIIARPTEEQEYLLGRLLARFSELKIAEAQNL